jgi:hypothetical protein
MDLEYMDLDSTGGDRVRCNDFRIIVKRVA